MGKAVAHIRLGSQWQAFVPEWGGGGRCDDRGDVLVEAADGENDPV